MLSIFCHIGNFKVWLDIKNYLINVNIPFDLYLNISELVSEYDRNFIKSSIKTKYIFELKNKGCDIGPLLYFLNYLRINNIEYEDIIHIHTKTDDIWRTKMLKNIFDNLNATILKYKNIYGCLNMSYDYINYDYDIDFLQKADINFINNWNIFDKVVKKTFENDFDRLEYLKNNLETKIFAPHICSGLYEKLLKNKDNYLQKDNFQRKIILFLRLLKNQNKLYYYPGTFLLFKHKLFNETFKKWNLIDIYNELEVGKANDLIIQSKTHSLERIIPIGMQLYLLKEEISMLETFLYKEVDKKNIDNYLLKIKNEFHYMNINDSDNKKIKILSNYNLQSISNNIMEYLKKLKIDSEIITDLNESDLNNDNLYIIIYSKDLKIIPKKYIFYQIEQKTSNFFTEDYLNAMRNAQIVWDFSIDNYSKYDNIIPLDKLFIQPFILNRENNQITEVEANEILYDILFYGAVSERRNLIMNELSKKYRVYYSTSLHGEEKYDIIKKSKIILNIHYYDDASLETCRLNEILPFNKIIISEKVNLDLFNMELYKDMVIFIDKIENNFDELLKTVDKYINNHNYDITKHIMNTEKKINYILEKNLFISNLCENFNFEYDLFSDKIYCLHLLETPFRLNAFKKQLYLPEVEIFPAVKYSPAWQGCGLSYKTLMYNAKRCNLKTITICEDDCAFNEDFNKKYLIINEFLNKISNWDIFVGTVAGLPKDTKILNIYNYKGIKFIEVDKMHSMVFNIYNYTSFDKIIQWDFKNKDVDTNTIDQYIKRQNMKIIITYPFEFSCLNVKSSIWGKNLFNEYNKMFQESLDLLKNKIENYDPTR